MTVKVLVLFGVGMLMQGCASSQKTMQKLLEPVVYAKCEQALDESKLWRVSSLLMTTEQRKKVEQKTCQCVAENALNDVPVEEVSKAMINESAKKELVEKAVMNSIRACIIKMK
jgi:uncharacterized protein YceK